MQKKNKKNFDNFMNFNKTNRQIDKQTSVLYYYLHFTVLNAFDHPLWS